MGSISIASAALVLLLGVASRADTVSLTQYSDGTCTSSVGDPLVGGSYTVGPCALRGYTGDHSQVTVTGASKERPWLSRSLCSFTTEVDLY